MSMTQARAFAFAMALALAGSAARADAPDPFAGQIAALQGELKQLRALEKSADDADTKAKADSTQLKKEDDKLKAEERRLPDEETSARMEYAKQQEALNTKWAWFGPAADAYRKRGCPMGGTVDDKTWARCGADHEKMMASKAELGSDLAALEGIKDAVEKHKKELAERREALSKATLANALAQKKAEAALEDAKAKIKDKTAALAALVGQCRQKFSSVEEMKLKCGNVQFDGADPNLPPL